MSSDYDNWRFSAGFQPKARHYTPTPDEESLINDEVANGLDRVEQEKLESDINRALNAQKDSVQP